jgi:glucokinase
MTDIHVGIDIGGTKMLLIATDDKCDRIERCDRFATGQDFTPVQAEAMIAEFVGSLPQPPASVGIAVPGLVDGTSGRVIACDVLPQIVGWLPTVKIDRLRIVNDAEAALIKTIACSDSTATTVVIMVGTGIGASLYVNGDVLRGAKGWAGELGSIPIGTENNGVTTLDRSASGAAILARFGGDAETLIEAIEDRDAAALKIVSDAGWALGLGIATVINIFNPDLIVLAGGTLAWSGYVEAASSSAAQLSLPDLWMATKLQISPHGSNLVALGAAVAGVSPTQRPD